jgi:acyl-CoA reductase-like NAD-dependent aldehyde dehydrogenase
MKTVWGLNTPGAKRGELLLKLADLIDQIKEELAAIEAFDNGRQPLAFGTAGNHGRLQEKHT